MYQLCAKRYTALTNCSEGFKSNMQILFENNICSNWLKISLRMLSVRGIGSTVPANCLQLFRIWRFDIYSTRLFISLINQLDAQNLFHNKFISCIYMFRPHVLIIRMSKLHYTASSETMNCKHRVQDYNNIAPSHETRSTNPVTRTWKKWNIQN